MEKVTFKTSQDYKIVINEKTVKKIEINHFLLQDSSGKIIGTIDSNYDVKKLYNFFIEKTNLTVTMTDFRNHLRTLYGLNPNKRRYFLKNYRYYCEKYAKNLEASYNKVYKDPYHALLAEVTLYVYECKVTNNSEKSLVYHGEFNAKTFVEAEKKFKDLTNLNFKYRTKFNNYIREILKESENVQRGIKDKMTMTCYDNFIVTTKKID